MHVDRSIQILFAAVLVVYLALVSREIRAGDRTVHSRGVLYAVTAPNMGWDDPMNRNAWDEFIALVHPSASAQSRAESRPEWLRWKNKCEAQLLNSCRRMTSTSDPSRRADASSAEIPRQVLLDFKKAKMGGKDTAFVTSFLRSAELASVLFNDEAADSIRRNNLGRRSYLDLAIRQLDAAGSVGADRRLPSTTFQNGSEIVKLVWEIVPARGQVVLFNQSAMPTQAGSNQLLPVPFWLSRYALDPDTRKACPSTLLPYGSPEQPTVAPLRCFYSFKIHGKGCSTLSDDVIKVWCAPPAASQTFYAVLVAFHVMKLVSSNPNWIWMTYYWTRDINNAETGADGPWAAPWNHFHEYNTTAIREEAPAGHDICFNPYLEGPKENGLKANCLSCHSFSAYSPAPGKPSVGVELGSRYPFPLDERAREERSYFLGSVQTAFLWSISTNQDTESTDLLASFQSELEIAMLDQVR
jgi:hypothetical protein